jgi:hypothetical protein
VRTRRLQSGGKCALDKQHAQVARNGIINNSTRMALLGLQHTLAWMVQIRGRPPTLSPTHLPVADCVHYHGATHSPNWSTTAKHGTYHQLPDWPPGPEMAANCSHHQQQQQPWRNQYGQMRGGGGGGELPP